MKTTHREITDETLERDDWPINLSVFPNQMGINLCSVDSLTWTRLSDGQLVSLIVHFKPEKVYVL